MLLRSFAIALLALPLTAATALAHHPLGGATPATFGEGLLSGIGHPILGFDHLAFVIAAGLIAATLRSKTAALLPLAYLAAMAVGLILHVSGVMLPAAEWVITLSVLLLGLLVARGKVMGATTLAGLFALAGLFHGFAFAEAIIGAEPTPLVAYIVGLVGAQYAIALAAFAVARLAIGAAEATPVGIRIAGGVIAGVGLTFFLEGVEGAVFSDMQSAGLLLSLPVFG
ncbi:MAG: hypothetical protein Kilf2KO_12970 [Rhodospirillales bacterium]